MPQAYKLRLGDGSVIHLDRANLRSWYERGLIGDDTSVQVPGSSSWTRLAQSLDVRDWRRGGSGAGARPRARVPGGGGRASASGSARRSFPSPWPRRLAMGVAVAVVVGAAAAAAPWWLPAVKGWLPGQAGEAAAPESPEQAAERRKREAVQAAVQQLPHLSGPTVELVMASSAAGVLDPPEVFRRAYEAAGRGLSVLTRPESQELARLNSSLSAALGSAERERLAEYIDRVRSRRPTSPLEDTEMGRLVRRGALSLPPPSRTRLQELFGKAVAAALPAAQGAEAGSSAGPTR